MLIKEDMLKRVVVVHAELRALKSKKSSAASTASASAAAGPPPVGSSKSIVLEERLLGKCPRQLDFDEVMYITYIRIYTHTYIYTYIHTYIHTHIHTHIHTYTHTYMYKCCGVTGFLTCACPFHRSWPRSAIMMTWCSHPS